MALVTSDFLAALFTNYHVIWEQAFLAANNQVDYKRYCMVVDSSTDTESYSWLGTVPQMVQWIDERQIQNFYAYNYSLQNLPYEVTVEVRRSTLEDDKYNTIRPRIAQLGQEAARFPAKQAALALSSLTATGYDGLTFYNTAHVIGSDAAQSNKLTGTGTTLAQVRADFITGRTAMRRFNDDQGRPMNIAPDLVVIPPDLQDVFDQLINSTLIASPVTAAPSNVLSGAVDIIVDANLSDTNDWYLLDTHDIVKPLIYQMRVAPEFTALDAPDSPGVFFRDRIYYGVRARFAFGYGDWVTAVRVVN